LDPSPEPVVWDLYLVYLLEQIMHVNVNDLFSQAKNNSSYVKSLLDHSVASVSGVVSEIKGNVVDPLEHAIEQPISNLSHSINVTSNWLKMATYVGGGWLLYAAYTQYADPVPSMAKRQLESIVDHRIGLSNRKRRRY